MKNTGKLADQDGANAKGGTGATTGAQQEPTGQVSRCESEQVRLLTCLPAAGSVAQRLSGSNGRQLDLGFRAGPRPRQQLLRSRAKFWFDQMRRVVDAAVEWKPAPLPRPEQGMLDLTRKTEVTLAK